MIQLLKKVRQSCFEGYDGTWDCTTEDGREGFLAMATQLDEVIETLSKHEPYGIFCMAMAIGGDSDGLDVWWDRATVMYAEFLMSPYNNPYKSELECINEYVKR